MPWLADMLTVAYSLDKQELPLERSSKPPYIISVAQFRPEKVHNLFQYFFELFIQPCRCVESACTVVRWVWCLTYQNINENEVWRGVLYSLLSYPLFFERLGSPCRYVPFYLF